MIYFGKTDYIVKYFNQIGYNCPSESNPADYFVDLVSIDNRTQKTELIDKKRVKYLENMSQIHLKSKTDMISLIIPNESMMKTINESQFQCDWFNQIFILTKRFYLNNYRNKLYIYGGMIQSIALGLIIMGIFYHLTDTIQDITSRTGLMYVSISALPYILLIVLIERISTDIKIYDREIQDNMYHSSSFIIAYMLCNWPQLILQGLLYALPIYYGCNLRFGSFHVFVYLSITVIILFIIDGLTWMSISIHRTYSVASLICNMSYTFIGLTSGFLVNIYDLPVYISWVKYVSFQYYAYRLFLLNELNNRIFDCPFVNQNSTNTTQSTQTNDCSQFIGNNLLYQQNITSNDSLVAWIMLFMIGFAYYLIAFVLIMNIKHPPIGIVGGDLELDNDTSEIDIKSDVEVELVNESANKSLEIISNTEMINETIKDTNLNDKSIEYKSIESNESNETIVVNSNESIEIIDSIESINTNELNELNESIINENPITININNLIISVIIPTKIIPKILVNETKTSYFNLNHSNRLNININNNQTIMNETKELLVINNLTIKPNRLIALMGASGSGMF